MDLNKTPNISIIEEQLNSTTFISECPATCSNEGNTLENFFIRSYRTPGFFLIFFKLIFVYFLRK